MVNVSHLEEVYSSFTDLTNFNAAILMAKLTWEAMFEIERQLQDEPIARLKSGALG